MNLFVKQLNADAQDSAATPEVEATTATTNAPVEETATEVAAEETPVIVAAEEVAVVAEEETPVAVAAVEEAPIAEVAPETPVIADEPVVEVVEEVAAPEFVTEPASVEPVVAYQPVEEVIATAHDDFDWSVDKRNVSLYAKEEKVKYDKVYEDTFVQIEDGQIMDGLVVGLTKTDVVVNIGFKSDGLISLNEFRDNQGLKVGDLVEVMVVEKEDKNGNLTLSRKSAKNYRAWQRIVELNKTGEVVSGYVTSKTKGGLIVEIYGMETFLPGSQIDVKPVADYDQFVGKTMEFKVVKINETIKNAVVSHKALIESDMEAQRVNIMSKLEKGQVLEGVVKNLTDFGAFMDLGGLDGLLYITDISWGRISHPSDLLKIDQKVNVVVLDFDDDKKRISLGLKQLTPHPWDVLPADLAEGSVVRGKVVNIEDYGAFLEVQPGVEGLVHVSEITWANTPVNAKEFFKLGDEHDSKVVTLDKDTRKMSLSIKQMTTDPWDTIENKYAVESKHKGLVKNITPYGVFVELEPGIGGMIHISDLSWLKRLNHPSDYVKVGQHIDIMIMGIDKDNRKLQLGHKQLEEDPWSTLEDTFGVGTKHEGTVTRRDDKGALVQLAYGLEGFAPARHLNKEDGKAVVAEETLEFVVIEFDRNDKRILLSHSRVWEQAQIEVKESAKKEARAESEKTAKEVKVIQAKVEKTTLGELSALADIRAKLEEGEKK